jgi:hypothetical protein
MSGGGGSGQKALDTASIKGGTVFLPPGTYRCNSVAGDGRVYCLLIGSNVKLMGAGRGASIIKLANNQDDDCRIIANQHQADPTGDSNITFSDFSIDGNANNQSYPSDVGIKMVNTQKVVHERIYIKNIKALLAYEGVAFDSYFSNHNSYTDCEATRTLAADSTGSGFSASYSSDIEYKGCRASHSTRWQGFTNMRCRSISYVNCHSYKNFQRGFNSERSEGVLYANCIAGGKSTDTSAYPYLIKDTTLGNKGDGFYLWNSSYLQLVNCISNANQTGIFNTDSSYVRVIGGEARKNTQYGLFFSSTTEAFNTRIKGGPIVRENSICRLQIGSGPGVCYNNSIPGPVTPPGSFPTSTTGYPNPFPYDAKVYVSGATVTAIAVSGQVTGITSGLVIVPAGDSINVTYSSGTPSWKWFID